jgi:hypothetical protein
LHEVSSMEIAAGFTYDEEVFHARKMGVMNA